MSFLEDKCDFCGRNVDPMGNDIAHHVEEKYWCGSCDEGLMVKFAFLSDDMLDNFIDATEIWVKNNPFTIPQDLSPEAFKRHLLCLRNNDDLGFAYIEKKRRKNG